MPQVPDNALGVFSRWLKSLKAYHPALHEELETRSRRSAETRFASESVSASDRAAVVLETIVREGRPAFLVQKDDINLDSNAAGGEPAKAVVTELTNGAGVIKPMLPLVGRIDLANYPGSLDYVGTGWLVDRNVVVTNRHVAQLVAQEDRGTFRFKPGRFGDDLLVSLDYCHEFGSDRAIPAAVTRVIWIETDAKKADIAFLEVERRTGGVNPEYIPLADADAGDGDFVAVVGYPARAPAYLIPDQVEMDHIYANTYDVKRIAPGQMHANTEGWATHDCTTLGGNSGSVVLSMKSGKAVALHFAGLYMIENYAVPASTVNRYLRERPWQGRANRREDVPKPTPPPPTPPSPSVHVVSGGQVSFTIPLTITVSLGQPAPTTSPSLPANIDEAARTFARQFRLTSIVEVWPGFVIRQGRMTDTPCLVVSVLPEHLPSVRAQIPPSFGQFPIDVRPASIAQRFEAAGAPLVEEAVTSVMYNDADRTGKVFSFAWADELMDVILHVGPERSWTQLSEFLDVKPKQLVSSMYQFHAAHVGESVEAALRSGCAMKLVLAKQSRDPSSGEIPDGDFDRDKTFAAWRKKFEDQFENIFVPLGSQGLVANAYHIKVTVRDDDTFWLSSGNWTRTSQPKIDPGGLDDPKVAGNAGNREWHAIVTNKTLAERFRNHILADLEQCKLLGGTEEAVAEEILVDVQNAFLEAMVPERAPERLIEPKSLSRKIRVKPLLTPDMQGAVYSEAALELIRSAKKQLLFQNQYIKMRGAGTGFMNDLVNSLAEKAQELDDFRIILRKPNGDLPYDLAQLKRRGVNVQEQVRLMPKTHTKGIVVDGSRVLLGSHNWSSSGVTLNRDASLIFDDEEIAQYYADAFEVDWNRATEPSFDDAEPESVQPATGGAPPPGFRRMSLEEYLEG